MGGEEGKGLAQFELYEWILFVIAHLLIILCMIFQWWRWQPTTLADYLLFACGTITDPPRHTIPIIYRQSARLP